MLFQKAPPKALDCSKHLRPKSRDNSRFKMAPRRPFTDAKKEEKNRKQRERIAQQDPQLKAKQAEESRTCMCMCL